MSGTGSLIGQNHPFAEFECVTLRPEMHEADGTGIGLFPLEQMGTLLEESIEKTQIARDDF
jgi:hypothetical protein